VAPASSAEIEETHERSQKKPCAKNAERWTAMPKVGADHAKESLKQNTVSLKKVAKNAP
jgi:hypothetical protein